MSSQLRSTDQPLDLRDLVLELTRPRTHREPLVREGTARTVQHITRVPSLLTQLSRAGQPSTGEAGTGGYASRPAAAIESLDTLIHIDTEAARWVRDLGEDDLHLDTAATVRQLHGLHASAYHCRRRKPRRDPDTRQVTCCTAHQIEADVRRWWTQARIVTGWDSPSWRPDNTCPVCARRGSLRVRLVAQAGMCLACRTTWEPETIGLLAEHIRHENRDSDTPEAAGA